MTETFETALRMLLGIEGGFADDPADSGGATRHGITEAVARAHGYTGPMRALPLDTAGRIYRTQYWELMRLDDIAALSTRVAVELFDTGVNAGVAVAAKFLQRSLNALNRLERDYPDVTVDGVLGPMTVSALRTYLSVRAVDGETVLLRALNSLQGVRYIELAERRRKDERFLFGWLRQRVVI